MVKPKPVYTVVLVMDTGFGYWLFSTTPFIFDLSL